MSLTFNTDLYMCNSAGAHITLYMCVYMSLCKLSFTLYILLYMHKASSFTNAAIKVTLYVHTYISSTVCKYCQDYPLCMLIRT